MNDHDIDVKAPMLKMISAWVVALVTSAWHTWQAFPWSTLAQFLAAVYSAMLIVELIVKKYRKWKDKDGSKQDVS